MDAHLEKSEKYTDGGLKTLAVLEAIPKRTAAFKEEMKQRESCKSRVELTEWISKLNSAKRSYEGEISSLAVMRETVQKNLKDLDSQIMSSQNQLNRLIDQPDSSQDQQFDLLNQITRHKNEKKAQAGHLQRLEEQAAALAKQVTEAEQELTKLQRKIELLKT